MENADNDTEEEDVMKNMSPTLEIIYRNFTQIKAQFLSQIRCLSRNIIYDFKLKDF
jgi:hypothetical protein